MSPIPSTGDPVEVYRLPSYTLQASPVTHHGVSYRPEKNGTGSGSVTITLDDPAYEDIAVNDVIAIRRDGETVAALLVEMIGEHTLDADGGARQTATYSGRLVGAQLEWAVIAPALGAGAQPIEDDCVLDWRSPRYNAATYGDTWAAATELISVTAAKAGGWPTTPMGQDFTDSTGAKMIWASSGSTSSAPAGECLFLADIEITSPGRHGLEVIMDNDGFVWVDGVQQLQISQTEGYHRASFKRIELSEGTHRFAFRVRNIDGPGALAFNLFKTDHQDRPLPGVAVVAISDSSTLISEYPSPFPMMTVGDDLGLLLDEAQARGKLTWIVPTFTVDEDSNGDPWDRDSIATKTGTTTLLQFLDELVAAGRVSRWRLRPDGVSLDVFAPGYSTRPGDVTLTPAPVNDPRTGQVLQLDRKIT